MSVQPFVFGSGILWVVPLQDINGNTIATPTPQRFTLQDMTLDIDTPVKELTALYQYPLAIGRGAGKVSGKVKFANVNIGLLNSAFFGETGAPVAGGANQVVPVNDEAATIPATPYQVTVANSASISAGNPMTDLGVRYGGTGAAGGQYLTAVANAPTAGQYSVNLTSGVYTFNSGDTTKAVLLDYSFAPNASSNQSILIQSHLLGTQPIVKLIGKSVYGGSNIKLAFQFNQVVGSKLGYTTKTTDFVYPELDFMMFADGGLNLGIITGAFF
ncbi:MAG TPA: hypothetical protein VKS22_13235 [Candidatus Binataceae bacterium]|nr:hypothetical protein [Candidatus Binataceae bacterium]